MTDPRQCLDCGTVEQRTDDGRTNLSPWHLCLACIVKRSKVWERQHLPADVKVAQAGDKDDQYED